MSSVIGNLIGGFLGGGKVQKQRGESRIQTPASQQSTSSADPNTKARVAGKLALIKTGAGGVPDESVTGRKKLLGN